MGSSHQETITVVPTVAIVISTTTANSNNKIIIVYNFYQSQAVNLCILNFSIKNK
jgi:hypothetical protein